MIDPVAPISAAPNLDDELVCPLCDYNLRGLPDPRCPECGHQFEWEALRRAVREKHPWLFEAHPRANLWSFAQTLRHGWRPMRFWRSILPGQKTVVGRQIGYALIVLGAAGFILVACRVPEFVRWRGFGAPARDALIYMIEDPEFQAAALGLIAWPVLSFCALLIFQQTMSRAKIRSSQVLRCVVYSYDWVLPLWLAVCVVDAIWVGWRQVFGVRSAPGVWWWTDLYAHVAFRIDAVTLILLSVAWVLVATRLAIAYRCYLRFPGATRTAVLSQVVVLSSMSAALFLITTL